MLFIRSALAMAALVFALPLVARAQSEAPPPVSPTLALPAPAPPPAPTPPPPRGWLARWLAPPAGAEPLFGYGNGNLFLRDPHSWFVVFLKGRVQVDSYNFAGRAERPAGVDANSAKDPNLNLKNTVFLRRARLALAGTLFKYIDFILENEFAASAATGALGTITDASITVNYLPYLQLEVGQMPVPFTLDNRTSENYGDFMERGLISRAFAAPNTRDIGAMLFGWLPRRLAYYSIGVFNGDGQDFKNQDNYPAAIGRAFIAPLAALPRHARWVEDIWIGGSYWWQKNSNVGGFVTPSTTGAAQNDLPGLTTQGGVGYFSSNYANGVTSGGSAVRAHLAPDGITQKYALELSLPLKRVGVRAEWAHLSIDLRQYNDAAGSDGAVVRSRGRAGNLSGDAYYVELYGWILGDVNYIDTPGIYPKPHWRGYTPPVLPRFGLSLAAKYEHVGLTLNGLAPAAGEPVAAATLTDAAVGRYALDVFELGANLWFSRHLRLAGNYVYNYFNDGNGISAVAAKNPFNKRAEHEILFRFQAAL